MKLDSEKNRRIENESDKLIRDIILEGNKNHKRKSEIVCKIIDHVEYR